MSPSGIKPGRVVRKVDFEQAYATGTRRVGSFFVSFVRPTDSGRVRLGVVASRRVGNAVARNRAKRLLREVFRNTPPPASPSRDIVLIARRAIVKVKMQAVDKEYRKHVVPMLAGAIG